MYRQGRRFAKINLAMQAKSFLAAINALTLVEKRDAWILETREIETYIPKEEFSQPPVDLVTLDDMRAEYAQVLAQLQLGVKGKRIYGDRADDQISRCRLYR